MTGSSLSIKKGRGEPVFYLMAVSYSAGGYSLHSKR